MPVQNSQHIRRGEQNVEHLLRRAGFGSSQDEIDAYLGFGFSNTVDYLLRFDRVPDDVDSWIGTPGYIGMTVVNPPFAPAQNIAHARQRWIFRMVHTRRPLQEKMTLFWHNHFATAYSKVAGALGATEGARYMAAKPSEDPNQVSGQIETLRTMALGNFRDILVAMAKDVAMLVWLDGRLNVKANPQENFGRELMELFTMGVGHYTEEDVYAAARVFTGWNLARPGNGYYSFNYVAAQHNTDAKTFTFAVSPGGSKTIPARSADAGMQDGLDLIDAVARHPATGPRLALKLYRFFISEIDKPDAALIDQMAKIYYQFDFEMKPVLAHLLRSPQFIANSARYARYSWPVEFVVRSIKEVGWNGFAISDANIFNPLLAMGQQLYEPPDVNGWELGAGWFSSGGTLARMNFASTLATNQKFNLRDTVKAETSSPETLLALMTNRLTPSPFTNDSYNALLDYVRAGGAWTNSDTQIANKAAGLAHLIVGSGNYQLV